MCSKAHLRRELRRQRRSLPPAQRGRAARALAARAARSAVFRRSRRIAVYLSADGEMDPSPLVRLAWNQGKSVYLPVIRRHGARLEFRRYRPDSVLRPGAYRLPYPAGPRRALHAPNRLDLVLAPLVGFDRRGLRLGMGGGFYDRTFAALAARRWGRPRLVGLAYRFQQVADLPAEPWDVPLWGVFTEAGLLRLPLAGAAPPDASG